MSACGDIILKLSSKTPPLSEQPENLTIDGKNKLRVRGLDMTKIIRWSLIGHKKQSRKICDLTRFICLSPWLSAPASPRMDISVKLSVF